jgi:hypothetical protein
MKAKLLFGIPKPAMLENQGICKKLITTEPFNSWQHKSNCIVIQQITITCLIIQQTTFLIRLARGLEFYFPNISVSIIITH